MEEKSYTLTEHLEELRSRIIKSIICLIIATAFIFNFSDKIISFLVRPVGELFFILPQEAFITKIKIAFFCGFLISAPVILYQAWKFISSGLQANERKYILIFLPVSILFFFFGAVFSYFIIVPIAVRFLLGFATDFLSPMITISSYISFVATLVLAFGMIFQLPLISIFLTKIDIITPDWMAKKRRHAVVFIFIAAALLTPPDIITQCLMAIPLIFLYEISILFSKLVSSK